MLVLRLISICCNRVRHWLGNAFLWPFSVPINRRSHLKKQSLCPNVVGRVKNGTCQARFFYKKMPYVNVKVHDNQCFFVNVNKRSGVPAIVSEQSESASFVMLVEIYNVDMPAASNRDATVLLNIDGLYCYLRQSSNVEFNYKVTHSGRLRWQFVFGNVREGWL